MPEKGVVFVCIRNDISKEPNTLSESRSQLKPTVSVVIPAYNAEDTIGDTLASLMAQTLPGVEVVVVDDSSSDYTSAVVDDFIERCTEIRLIRNQKT